MEALRQGQSVIQLCTDSWTSGLDNQREFQAINAQWVAFSALMYLMIGVSFAGAWETSGGAHPFVPPSVAYVAIPCRRVASGWRSQTQT